MNASFTYGALAATATGAAMNASPVAVPRMAFRIPCISLTRALRVDTMPLTIEALD